MPMPPMPSPPPQGMMPPNAAAMFMQGMNTPPGAPAAAGATQPPGATPPPGLPPQLMGAQPPQPGANPPNTPQGQLAAKGRMGDTLLAHMTPGEIAVPPQVQTKPVIKAISKAFEQNHISPAAFTAGSPQSSINPQTNLPEYNFWSSFLPVALGIGGSLLMPGIGTSLGLGLSSLTSSAIGGGLGTMIGSLAGGKGFTNSLLAGGLSGLGSYGLGSLLAPAGDAATKAATESAANYVNSTPSAQVAADVAAEPMGAATASRGLSDILADPLGGGINPGGALGRAADAFTPAQKYGSAGGAGLGAFLAGSMFGDGSGSSGPALPPGFTDHAPSVSSLPSAREQLGMSSYGGPLPQFTGYNPYSLSPAAYNFYPAAA